MFSMVEFHSIVHRNCSHRIDLRRMAKLKFFTTTDRFVHSDSRHEQYSESRISLAFINEQCIGFHSCFSPALMPSGLPFIAFFEVATIAKMYHCPILYKKALCISQESNSPSSKTPEHYSRPSPKHNLISNNKYLSIMATLQLTWSQTRVDGMWAWDMGNEHFRARIVRSYGKQTIHTAHLGPLHGEYYPGVVILKTAEGADQVQHLTREAEMYKGPLRHLQGKVVPKCFGYYTGKRNGVDLGCLVLEYCSGPNPVLHLKQFKYVVFFNLLTLYPFLTILLVKELWWQLVAFMKPAFSTET